MRLALIIIFIVLLMLGVLGFVPSFGWAYIPIWGIIIEAIIGVLLAILAWGIFVLYSRKSKLQPIKIKTNEILPDITSPVITILGENPASIFIGDEYNDKGAVARDNVDGDITKEIKTINNLDTSKAGTYTITYIVKDNSGNEETKTRIINVLHRPPVATDDGFASIKNRIISIPIKILTSNDYDPEGGKISFIKVSRGKGGKAIFLPMLKRVFFKPDRKFIGLSSFFYTIQNEIGLQSNGTVWLSIGINELPNIQPPLVVSDNLSINKVFTVIPISSLLANDSDPQGSRIFFIKITNTPNKTRVISLKLFNRLLLFIKWGFSGNIIFSYTIKNSFGLQSTGAVTVTVNNAHV